MKLKFNPPKMKCICINLTKYVKDMYAENYKVLINKIEESQNKWRTYIVQKIGRFHMLKDYIFPYSTDLCI